MENGVVKTGLISCKTINILVVFDRILKDPDECIMKMIVGKYKNKFEKFVDMETLMSVDKNMYLPLLYSREEENILKWMAIKEFDYEKNYAILYNGLKMLYANSSELKMVKIVKDFITSFYVKNIYVYNETDDVRQRYELVQMFGDKTVKYVNGPLDKVIKKLGIHIVYDWDARRVALLNEYDEFDDVIFGVAEYKFNFEKDNPNLLKYNLTYRENVAHFNTLELEKESFLKG